MVQPEGSCLAIDSFLNGTVSLLPEYSYIERELRELQGEGFYSFEEALSMINPAGTVRDAASVLGRCRRKECMNAGLDFLECVKLFCEVEAKIRFSLWPKGELAPHHFSKLLKTKRVCDVFSQSEILAITAIVADEKGLNLRNIATHGFSVDTSLCLPLLEGLSQMVTPRLPNFEPPHFDFDRQQRLFEFHQNRLSYTPELTGMIPNRFALLDQSRAKCLSLAYDSLNSGKYVDSLMLLFPIFEHSLRRAAVALLHLPIDRLNASSQEHFLSIKECMEILPEPLRSMTHELLTAPDGPRLRDRIMHGYVRDIPIFFTKSLFLLFEKCVEYFDSGTTKMVWNLAFHPARCLEYEISKIIDLRKQLDFVKIYNSASYERLIECLIIAQECSKIRLKDESTTDFVNHLFPRFVCLCVLYFAGQEVKNSAIQNLLGLAHSPVKFGAVNDIDRFKSAVCDRVNGIRRYLPFLPKGSVCGYEMVETIALDESIFPSAIEFLEECISKADKGSVKEGST
jgi:hypothetical protein